MAAGTRGSYGHPYDEVAQSALDGKAVVVFCGSMAQLKGAKQAVAAHARRLGARKVVCPHRDGRVDVDGNSVRFLLANGIDGRGMTAEVAYLSESARLQIEFAHLMGAEVR